MSYKHITPDQQNELSALKRTKILKRSPTPKLRSRTPFQNLTILTMNIEARKQYMETLREKYFKASKKEKGIILNEYCRNTKQERKYAKIFSCDRKAPKFEN